MLPSYINFKSLLISCFVLLFMHNVLFGQERTPSGKLNRFIPYSIGRSINTSYDEINPVFSPDEKTIYFSRTDYPENKYGSFRSQDIYYAILQSDGTWSEAQRIDAPFNNNRFNAIYSITDDGRFLVSGVYRRNGTYKKRGLSIVKKTGDNWSNPERLKIPKITRGDKGLISIAHLSKSGDEIFLSYSGAWQKSSIQKLRYSHKKGNGKWKAPKIVENKVLGKRFNSIEAPFLSDDQLTLYFSASGKKREVEYMNDIYQMTRSDKFINKWSDLKEVDNVVNSSFWDSYYKLYNESNWAVFTQAEIGDDADIFIVKLHEPKPYVNLEGFVRLDGQLFQEEFEIMINGQVVDSVRIDKDAASYAVQLPLGSRYELKAKAFEKIAKIEVIDATEELEYLPLHKGLELSLIPFLDLSGTVTVNGHALQKNFGILVNGRQVDSLKIDTVNSTYSVKLPLGSAYLLEVHSKNYFPGQAMVDVTTEAHQIRIEKELELTTLPYVDISGQLYNTKTKMLVPSESSPKVLVNGLEVDSLAILNGKYDIRLPWGQKYILQLLVDDYEPVSEILDLVTVDNYREISQDLYASPLEKYATLTGKMINMKTNSPITVPFSIQVNGATSTNGVTNTSTGTYEVRLSLGQKVVVTGNADNFFPISEVVDLTSETENVKVIKDLQMMPIGVGEKILLNNIFYETGSTNLKPLSFSDIDRVVDLLRLVPTLKIEISGHTDSSGKDAFNLALSKSRAHSVATYILDKGIADDRVTYNGYGESEPITSNLTPEGRAKNRRVEFVVLEQ